MFDLEKAIKDWRKTLRRYETLEDGLIAEIEAQLRDTYEARKSEGLGDEEAFRTAAEQVGSVETIAAEYYKNRARGLAGGPPWRPSRFFPALAWNYAKTAWRKIRREKVYAAINIAGLAVGLACAVLTLLYVRQELRFDQYHARKDRIFRLVSKLQGASYDAIAKVPGPWAEAALKELPDIERTVRFFFLNETLVSRGGKRFYEEGGFYADPSVFDVFSFPLLKGNPATALTAPGSVVVTERFARKYFGDEDPLGASLTFDTKDEYLITGVIRNVPAESHFTFDFLVSMASYTDTARRDDWRWLQFYTYLLLKDGASPGAIAEKFPQILRRNLPESEAVRYTAFLQPLTDIHLRSRLFREMSPNSDIGTVTIFSAVALFILLIACINFMNLTTARAATRMKEVGVRKVAGASRPQLVRQFLGESVLMSGIAFAGALGVIAFLLPVFNSLTARSLVLFEARQAGFLAAMAGLALAVGLASGAYPAFVLSASKPAAVLKGRTRGIGGGLLRKGLVVFQFGVSALLMIATGVVHDQLGYIQKKGAGFDQDQLIIVPMRDQGMKARYEAVKHELAGVPGVVAVAASGNLPGGGDWGIPYVPEGIPRDKIPDIRILAVDLDFVATYRFGLAAGRGFSPDHPGDATGAFLINEEAARQLGWTDAVGKTIGMPTIQRAPAPVVGVLKDFHFRSLHEKIGPILLFIPPAEWMTVFSVRIRPENIPATLAALERKWRELDPAHPFTYAFLDERFARLYQSERRMGRLLDYVAALAVLVACLGLFGLATYSAERRTKEIGVRKVVGASAKSIVVLLSMEFTRLVAAGYVIAVPFVYYAMSRWLQGFAYRMSLGPGPFVAAGLAALAVAWLAVAFQSIRAALANPTESLRYE
jgi:putative ABC transport system permease protein